MVGLLERARVRTATTGTGTVTLSTVVPGYMTWANAGAVDATTYDYEITDGKDWEFGYGTYTSSGTTLSRNLVASSTGSLISLSGFAIVRCVAPTNRALIAQTIVSGTLASQTYSTLPTTFRDLQLIIRGRCDNAAQFVDLNVQFNGDTGSNYDATTTDCSGTAVSSGSNVATTALNPIGWLTGSTGPTSSVGATDIIIYDYNNTTFHKTFNSRGMTKNANSSGNTYTRSASGWWRSTAAITSLKVFPTSGNFITSTIISLYGLI